MKNLTISTKQMREDFALVINAMASGQSLTLLYRSQPLATIKPVSKPKSFGRSFTPKQINSWIKSDKLTRQEEQNIDELINRLP